MNEIFFIAPIIFILIMLSVPKYKENERIVVTHFVNGAVQTNVNDKLVCITYNTGDTCWFTIDNGEYKTCAYITHDGLKWGIL